MEQNNTSETLFSATTSSEVTSSIYDNLTLIYSYENINAKLYFDKENNSHLFLNDVELTKDIVAKEAYLYDSEYWSYKDYDKNVHLFKNNEELTKNIKTTGVLQHPHSGQWFCANEKNKLVPV